MAKVFIDHFTVPRFTHTIGLNASEKLIYSYIYEHIRHSNIESVIIPSNELAIVGVVTSNSACAIGRKLENLGLVCRRNVSATIDGKKRKAIEYYLPTIETT